MIFLLKEVFLKYFFLFWHQNRLIEIMQLTTNIYLMCRKYSKPPFFEYLVNMLRPGNLTNNMS